MVEDIRSIELTEEELSSISGGTAVKTGTDGNAGVWKRFDAIASGKADYSLPNGTDVTIIGAPKYHSGKGRHYVQIQFVRKGRTCKGWIAASIVGLAR